MTPERELRMLRQQLREKDKELHELRGRLDAPQIYGTLLDTMKVSPAEWWIADTAMRLKHIVVVRPFYDVREFKLRFFGVRP